MMDDDYEFDPILKEIQLKCNELSHILKSMYGPRSSDKMIVRLSAFDQVNRQNTFYTSSNQTLYGDGTELKRNLEYNSNNIKPEFDFNPNYQVEDIFNGKEFPNNDIYSRNSMHQKFNASTTNNLNNSAFYKNTIPTFRNRNVQITNDGATAIRLLTRSRKSVHPVHIFLSEISESQEITCGDGTTSVVLFTSFIFDELCKIFKKVRRRNEIVKTMKKVTKLALKYASLQCYHNLWSFDKQSRISWISKLVGSTLESKVLQNDTEWISLSIVVPIIEFYTDKSKIDREVSNENVENYIANRKIFNKNNISFIPVIGDGNIRNSTWINGIIFKRGLVYAGHKNQITKILNPKILLTSDEIEWKHLNENVRLVYGPSKYDSMIQLEWRQCKTKLDSILTSGATLLVSSRSIGDYATQFLSRYNIICIGNVSSHIIESLSNSMNIPIISSLLDSNFKSKSNLSNNNKSIDFELIGSCQYYQEIQLNGVWCCIFEGMKFCKMATILLHSSSKESYLESRRCFEDVFGTVDCILNNPYITFGGGAYEIYMSSILQHWSKLIDENNFFTNPIFSIVDSDLLKKELNLSFYYKICIEALSNSLLKLVDVLSENCGHNSDEMRKKLNYHYKTNFNNNFQKEIYLNSSYTQKDHNDQEFNLLEQKYSQLLLGISPSEDGIISIQHVIEPLAMKEGYVIRGLQAALTLFLCSSITNDSIMSREERAFDRYSKYREAVRNSK